MYVVQMYHRDGKGWDDVGETEGLAAASGLFRLTADTYVDSIVRLVERVNMRDMVLREEG